MARVIYADDLFRFMDQYNQLTIGRERLESFVKEQNFMDAADYSAGYLDALNECYRRIENEIMRIEKGTKTCANCAWYAPDDNVCCNEKSKHGLKYMYPSERCGAWALDKEDEHGNS